MNPCTYKRWKRERGRLTKKLKKKASQLKAIKEEEEKQKQKLEEERRKKEELSIDNIPDDGVISSPASGKTVRKLEAKHVANQSQPTRVQGSHVPHVPHVPKIDSTKNQKQTQHARSQSQSQSQSQPQSHLQPVSVNSARKRKPDERDNLEFTEKLNRVIKKNREEKIQHRMKEIGYIKT